VVHDYAAPLTHRLSVVAIENLPTVVKAANGHLGQGTATILIAPSPVSDAERLADDFLTLRFGLALLIALVVYYWRYQNKTVIFGARSFDYVEAFALGFAANAAALKLPEVMAKFAAM
jgi:hypothetical protein